MYLNYDITNLIVNYSKDKKEKKKKRVVVKYLFTCFEVILQIQALK